MKADLVLVVLAHEADPVEDTDGVNEEHDEVELQEGVLVRIQEAKAVHI